ncbi:LysR family transcriptional regulator [Lactobacillus sp. ESL0785]|uniref:LysR family transcriptional regulator n=1 Tax=Lactobacillus sp. ESL0785 TaxID=2983232 RepID=UPI0023F7B644|nr:LysR family transcriptional regulator [Lactobacillus sp. ESL0785]WEV71409.1 LysR family transcriptional regulator [Lactobacillus sp. ESL0785]
MKYNLIAIKYFVDVVETQGFTPAAKRNFVSQTAISNAVKNLEKEINIKLIDRSTSHFKVTPAGVNFYHYSVALLKHYYNFREKVSQLNNTYSTLRIHYLRGFRHWAIHLAQNLKETIPDIQLQLDTENFTGSIPKLDANDYDILIGFATAISKIKDIHLKSIGTANFGVLVNNSFQAASNTSQSLFLQKWSATDNNDVQTKIRIILKKMNIDYDPVIYLDSFDAALANIMLNHGMAIYPKELPIPKDYANEVYYLPNIPSLQYDVVAIYKDPAIDKILTSSLKY